MFEDELNPFAKIQSCRNISYRWFSLCWFSWQFLWRQIDVGFLTLEDNLSGQFCDVRDVDLSTILAITVGSENCFAIWHSVFEWTILAVIWCRHGLSWTFSAEYWTGNLRIGYETTECFPCEQVGKAWTWFRLACRDMFCKLKTTALYHVVQIRLVSLCPFTELFAPENN